MRSVVFLIFIYLPHHVFGSSLHHSIKRSTEMGDAFKPPDDVTYKQEDAGFGQGSAQQPTTAEIPAMTLSFNLPQWLMFFQEIWGEILRSHAVLKTKFSSEFESETDISEATNTEDGGFEMPEMNGESAVDGTTEAGEGAEWEPQDDINEMPEVPLFQNTPGISDDAFETPETGFSVSEVSEMELETGGSDDSGISLWQTNEADNTESGMESPEQETVTEARTGLETIEIKRGVDDAQAWIQNGIQGPGSWMQGMVDSAMFLSQLHEQSNNIGDTPAQSDDATNVLPEFTNFNNQLTGMSPAEDIDSHTRSSPFSNNDAASGSEGIGFGNHVTAFQPGIFGSTSGWDNHSGTNTPDNERDSSS